MSLHDESSQQYVASVLTQTAEYFASQAHLVAVRDHTVEVTDDENRRVLVIAVPVPETVGGNLTVAELIAVLSASELDSPVLMSGPNAGYQHVDFLALPDVDEGFVLPTLMGGADFDTRSA